jgi:glucokinase
MSPDRATAPGKAHHRGRGDLSMSQGVIIGVDVGGSNVRAAAIKGGEIVARYARPISSKAEEAVVVQEVLDTIDRVDPGNAGGIGCGVPSIVDLEHGIVRNVENIPSWRAVPLKRILEDRYGVPAFVNNDANCFALGEWQFGRAVGYRNVVGITIGTGLGAGLVLDGRLFSGPNCGAGEIGTIPYRDATVEHYCSGQRLLRETGVTGDVLFERAQGGDPEALSAFRELGRDLGHALLIVLYAYDPEIIVLGGSVASAFPYFEVSVRKELGRCPQPQVVERLVIARSEHPDIALLGAAALCLDAEMGGGGQV